MLKRNVLIFHQGALGDFVLTWPLGLALGRLYPQSRVIYVTQRSKGQLAEKALGLDWMDIDSGWSWLYVPDSTPDDHTLRPLRGAHTIVTFVAAAGSSWVANAQGVSGANIVAIDPTPPASWQDHASRWVLSQLEPHQAIHAAVQQLLRSVCERGVGVQRQPGGDLVIHPGAGSAAKCWPALRYIELAERLRAAGRGVRFVLGEVELEKWPERQLALFEKVGEVRRPGTYLELLAELTTAGQFLGNDSGPAHLAGALGVPTVVLYGPTRPETWRPLGPRVTTIHQEPLDALEVESVLAALAG